MFLPTSAAGGAIPGVDDRGFGPLVWYVGVLPGTQNEYESVTFDEDEQP